MEIINFLDRAAILFTGSHAWHGYARAGQPWRGVQTREGQGGGGEDPGDPLREEQRHCTRSGRRPDVRLRLVDPQLVHLAWRRQSRRPPGSAPARAPAAGGARRPDRDHRPGLPVAREAAVVREKIREETGMLYRLYRTNAHARARPHAQEGVLRARQQASGPEVRK